MYAVPIWQPKFSTMMVLVDRLKINDKGKTFIYFCADRNHPNLYSVDSTKVKQECKLTTNGKILCYNIPLDWLENEGELTEELKQLRDKQYSRFKKFMKKEK